MTAKGRRKVQSPIKAVTTLPPADRVPPDRRGTLGVELKEMRTRLGLRIDEIADKMGIPYRTYQDWELGNNTPSAVAIAFIKLWSKHYGK